MATHSKCFFRVLWATGVVVALFGAAVWPLRFSQVAAQDTATISGTVTYQSAPIADIPLAVLWEGGERFLTTKTDGTYRVEDVPVGIWVQVHVFPAPESGLVARHWQTVVEGDITRDFVLERGFQLSGEIRRPDGTLIGGQFPLPIEKLDAPIAEGEWLTTNVEAGRFQVMLPSGYYTLMPTNLENQERPDAIGPYFFPRTRIDLTQGDVSALTITLLQTPDPYPTTPPIAERVTVSEPDADGVATINGAPGAVEPLSVVGVVNLSALTMTVTVADAQGAFSTRLFAPPGSALLLKYGDSRSPFDLTLSGALNPTNEPVDGTEINQFPGTIIPVGPFPEGDEFSQPFNVTRGSYIGTHKWVRWWFSGTLTGAEGRSAGGLAFRPGQSFTLSGRARATSAAFDCTTAQLDTLRLQGHLSLQYAFGPDGAPKPWGIWFTSYLFTPTGLPIEYESTGEIYDLGTFELNERTCVSEHTIEATVNAVFTLPADLVEGVYQPAMALGLMDIPMTDTMPLIKVWYNQDTTPTLPPISIGEIVPPHIPWTLLANYSVNGHRGVQALEDEGRFAMPTRVVTLPHQVVIPRLDARTGQPLIYRLEPGSHWLSGSERRQPNPPRIPLALSSGEIMVEVLKPDGSSEILGPALIRQSSVSTPTIPGGAPLDFGTGQISDMYHLATLDDALAYSFDQYGPHTLFLMGHVTDVYGNVYDLGGTYNVMVARVLDLDPAQLPPTPYVQGNAFAPGLHIFPALPADVTIQVTHLPYSDPSQAVKHTFSGQANPYGIFHPALGDTFTFEQPGEFRVDLSASYQAPDGTLWYGAMTWGGVVAPTNPRIEAHGRRTMSHLPIDPNAPSWYEVANLPPELTDIEMNYPYFSGDIHWGYAGPLDLGPGGSIQPFITMKDLTPDQMFYNLLRQHIERATYPDNLETAIAVGEAPLLTTTSSGHNAAAFPEEIDLLSYWYGSSERPDVRVREIISVEHEATGYWRFDDTYGYQIGEGARGDLPGDLKWEFGGIVFRLLSGATPLNEYAIYSSLWVLAADDDPVGGRIAPPFQDATGASINGGPIMVLKGQDVDMLFLPKSIRPGDVLRVGDIVAFSGHVGPPLDSQVSVRITSPSGIVHEHTWHTNAIGWLYDPTFDFVADEAGRWTVAVSVLHDRPYVGNGVIPTAHNTGTVLGTEGQFEFYVVPQASPPLPIISPSDGFVLWSNGHVQPIPFEGVAPPNTHTIYYTVHDKGVVMEQGTVTPDADGHFRILYDAVSLNKVFSFLSLTAHEGRWEGLADEVTISMLAVGGETPQANTVTLLGEEIFVRGD